MVPAATVGARVPCRTGLESTAGKIMEFLIPTKHLLSTGHSAWPASTRWAMVNMNDCALYNGLSGIRGNCYVSLGRSRLRALSS